MTAGVVVVAGEEEEEERRERLEARVTGPAEEEGADEDASARFRPRVSIQFNPTRFIETEPINHSASQ